MCAAHKHPDQLLDVFWEVMSSRVVIQCSLADSYGAVESVRLRSVPVKLDAKMPRRAAILTGNVASDRGTANAYVVFANAASAKAALAHNMAEVRAMSLPHGGVSRTGAFARC